MELFAARFGGSPDGVWRAPGRANLMGEHTDYNQGFVLPFALGQGVAAAVARQPGRRLVLCSAQEPGAVVEVELDGLAPGQVTGWAAFPAGVAWALGQGVAAAVARQPGPSGWSGQPGRSGRRLVLCSAQEPGAVVEVELDGLAPGQVTGWAAFPAGVAWALEAGGYRLPGACLAIDSDLPAGAGLSSSAALECAAALALTELAGLDIGRPELAAIAQRAENEFVGVPSGIMDQSASLLGRRGHALLLDCRSLETSQVPFDPAAAGARLLLINTRAEHDLTTGAYGRRRAECERAARELGVPSLRYLTNPADVERLADPVLRRRARHVVTDDQRVLAVVALLTRAAPDAYPRIGLLLTQAHESLRDDFEVSWPQADAAVDAALAAGALGARMIGGGFGGSVLALVRDGAAGPVRAAVTDAFARRGWAAPDFLDAAAADGARRVE